MKVGINHTVEVTDDQRIALADVLDGKQSKRQATRDEFKAFIWEKGESWASELKELWDYDFNEGPREEIELEIDDLLGEDEDLDLEDLL